jgi:hypothetical protein
VFVLTLRYRAGVIFCRRGSREREIEREREREGERERAI